MQAEEGCPAVGTGNSSEVLKWQGESRDVFHVKRHEWHNQPEHGLVPAGWERCWIPWRPWERLHWGQEAKAGSVPAVPSLIWDPDPARAHPLCLELSVGLNKPVGVGGSSKIAKIHTRENSCNFGGEKAKLSLFLLTVSFPFCSFFLFIYLYFFSPLIRAVFSSNP